MHSRFCLLLLAFGLAATAVAQPADLQARLDRLAPMQRDEVLWLARCVYSESNREDEQRLVAWVVRNRVETGFRGTSYREVVLSPSQFSAFNPDSRHRQRILRLGLNTRTKAWYQALRVALDVYRAPGSQRPFARTVRHFYSPVSMRGRRQPHWAVGETPLPSARLGVDPHRFLFFEGLDEGMASGPALANGEAPPEGMVYRRPRLRTRSLSGRVKRPVRPGIARRLRTP